jgi:hypothetical protein
MRQDLDSLGWPGTHFVAQADIKLENLLPQSLECWDYRHAPPCVTLHLLFFLLEKRVLWLSGPPGGAQKGVVCLVRQMEGTYLWERMIFFMLSAMRKL